MNEINRELLEHKFTSDLNFTNSFEKFKCFRVIDEEGNVINKDYDNIDNDTL